MKSQLVPLRSETTSMKFIACCVFVAQTSSSVLADVYPYTYSGCDNATYYSSLTGPQFYDRPSLHSLTQTNHRSIIPYTSTAADCWDALMDLDAVNATHIHLIYRDVSIPKEPYGQTDTWNREHVFPKSHGVGYSGPDYTDLHSLKPADWSVNSARSNRFFSSCGITESIDGCVIPASAEADPSTSRDVQTFMPPTNARGDVARAVLYMALRYDGDAFNEEDLTVTDCPEDNPSQTEMAFLSQLLQWHMDDPPSEEEIQRNQNICTHYQGNRNPFVDMPHLVSYYYGQPRTPLGDGLGYDCSTPNPPGPPMPEFPSTLAPTSTPPHEATTGGTCQGLTAGDVMITGFRSDSPDTVVMVAMTNLPPGAVLYMTDNAWTGTNFRSNEGTVKMVVPEDGIAEGSIFGYGDVSLPLSYTWSSVGGYIALATVADTIIIYCLDDDPVLGTPTVPYHLSALSYASSGWLPANPSDPDSFGTGSSALPDMLPSSAVVTLSHRDNYRYEGPRSGHSRSSLMDNYLSNSLFWFGSDSTSFDVIAMQTSFTLDSGTTTTPSPTGTPTTSPTPSPTTPDLGTCKGLLAGDIMIAGFNSDNPDTVGLVALQDIPTGVELYLTDAAWTGSEFTTGEGKQKLVFSENGLATGTVFGFGGTDANLPMSSSWVSASSSSFLLSASSDNIFLYCIDSDGTSPRFLSALTYSTSAWVVTGSISASESHLPSTLPSNTVITLPHKDNYIYSGPRTGTQSQLLQSLSDTNYWTGKNSVRLAVPSTSFEVLVSN
mmetsp:Transcript_1069/g.1693  ORF Transcript_1069/g.1693 Transcript_1069/m.1693 type:complete len:773 (-) Transcript_1069:152-2470(-)